MKKIMILEIVVLLVLLIVSIVVCTKIAGNRNTPDIPAEDTVSTEPEETTVPEETTAPTEPETTMPDITWMTVPAERQLLARQYFVYDVAADAFITSSATADEKVYPASITKLLTAYVVLQYLEPDRQIVAGDALDQVSWDSSVAGIGKGDTLSTEQLIEAMLLPSGNDAAYILAAETGRVLDHNMDENAVVAVMTFVEEMNRQAQSLGMTGSHFVNPDGMHSEDHYMTYADLCLLGKLSLQNATIKKYTGMRNDVVTLPSHLATSVETEDTDDLEPGQVEWKNTNRLIHPESDYYCPYAIGLKTGQTSAAGSCLLSAFEINGHQWIIGVFGCPEETDRFEDTIQLFNEIVCQP